MSLLARAHSPPPMKGRKKKGRHKEKKEEEPVKEDRWRGYGLDYTPAKPQEQPESNPKQCRRGRVSRRKDSKQMDLEQSTQSNTDELNVSMQDDTNIAGTKSDTNFSQEKLSLNGDAATTSSNEAKDICTENINGTTELSENSSQTEVQNSNIPNNMTPSDTEHVLCRSDKAS